jgi:uracil-DNA glycosylase
MLDRMLENVLGTDRGAIVLIDLIRDTREPAQIGAGVLAALSAHQPKVILVMGTFAARAMFSDEDSVVSTRGDWRPLVWPGGQADARVTHHPEAILALAARGEHAPKRETFGDLKAVGERLSRS